MMGLWYLRGDTALYLGDVGKALQRLAGEFDLTQDEIKDGFCNGDIWEGEPIQ